MRFLQVLMIAFLVVVTAYTVAILPGHGMNFAPVFLNDLVSLSWRGQFNLDFMTYLMLSGLWIAWRGGFSAGAIVLGLVASVLGMPVLALYVLMAMRTAPTMEQLLLGVHARDADRPG